MDKIVVASRPPQAPDDITRLQELASLFLQPAAIALTEEFHLKKAIDHSVEGKGRMTVNRRLCLLIPSHHQRFKAVGRSLAFFDHTGAGIVLIGKGEVGAIGERTVLQLAL